MSWAIINCIRKVDFTKGFSSRHVQWPVRNLEDQGVDFEITAIHEDGAKSAFEGHLSLHKSDKYTFVVGMDLYAVEEGMQAVVVRQALCCKGKEPLRNTTYVLTTGSGAGIDSCSGFSADDMRSYVRHDMVFHCWIDVPNDPPKVNNQHLNGDLISDDLRLQARQSLSTDFGDMFKGVLDQDPEMKALSDITLTALDENGQWRSFHCHRIVLSARSSVFRRMFANEKWKEAANKNGGVVEIEGIGAEALEYVLKYIYTGAMSNEDENEDGHFLPFCRPICQVWDVIHAADKYNLPELIELWSAVLIFEYGDECHRIDQICNADRYQLHQVKAVCIAALSTNLAVFGNTELLEVFPKELLSELLQASTKRQLEEEQVTVETASG